MFMFWIIYTTDVGGTVENSGRRPALYCSFLQILEQRWSCGRKLEAWFMLVFFLSEIACKLAFIVFPLPFF